ncbi:MAG: hypothetical protein ACFE8A_00100 [Candidatus Hodarchaeota archaeon]
MSDISKEILERIPKECEECSSIRIEFWEKTEEKYLFRCIDCGAFYPIPINPDKLHLYPEL